MAVEYVTLYGGFLGIGGIMNNYVQKLINEKADISTFIHLWNSLKANNISDEELNSYFQKYIANNKKYCIEDFFKEVKLDNHSCCVHFIPTSKSYSEFGENVTIVDFVCSDEECKQYFNNIRNNQLSYGHFKIVKLSNTDQEILDGEIELSTYDIHELETI